MLLPGAASVTGAHEARLLNGSTPTDSSEGDRQSGPGLHDISARSMKIAMSHDASWSATTVFVSEPSYLGVIRIGERSPTGLGKAGDHDDGWTIEAGRLTLKDAK